MTAQAPPESAGPVELLAPNPNRRATRANQLLCESQGPAAEDARDRRLALVSADARDVSRIRRLAKDFLTGLNVSPTARDDALLIISELVTNAVLHALPPHGSASSLHPPTSRADRSHRWRSAPQFTAES